MDHDMGVCSIGYGELTAILLFPQQREHAVRPAPGLWNGRPAGARRGAPVSAAPRVSRSRDHARGDAKAGPNPHGGSRPAIRQKQAQITGVSCRPDFRNHENLSRVARPVLVATHFCSGPAASRSSS
jgi:hypothetical protein